MFWLWSGVAVLFSVPVALFLFLVALHYWLRYQYLEFVIRIFQEKPLFIVPRGQPVVGAEEIELPTTHGLTLRGCYIKTKAERRKGVILFGLEFGSNRWSCVPYCEQLLEQGYDVCAFEPRGQGDSPCQPGYDPLQWVTEHEVNDYRAALAYLKNRPDAEPNGIGLFGISKGAAAGIIAADRSSQVRCVLTDGVFATYSTMVPYMRKWVGIYNNRYVLQGLIPLWYYGLIGKVALSRIARVRHCRFPHLEPCMARLNKPLLMIHGGGDTYIKPEMGQGLFARAPEPKEFWMVEGAKHNQALHLFKAEYQRRVLEFFDRYLAVHSSAPAPTPSGLPPALLPTVV